MLLQSDESRTDWRGDLPAPMKAAIEQFLSQLGAAIDSVDPVKRRSTHKYQKTTAGRL